MASTELQVVADGSDIIAVTYDQNNGTPNGASESMAVRGFNIDIAAVQVNAKTGNTPVGNFTGNH